MASKLQNSMYYNFIFDKPAFFNDKRMHSPDKAFLHRRGSTIVHANPRSGFSKHLSNSYACNSLICYL